MTYQIEFKYPDNVRHDDIREANMRNNLEMWLRPYEDDIKQQHGIIHVLFSAPDHQIFSVENVTQELKNKLRKRFDEFRN